MGTAAHPARILLRYILHMHDANIKLRKDFVMRGGGNDGGSETSGDRGDPHARCTHDGGGTFCSVGSNHMNR